MGNNEIKAKQPGDQEHERLGPVLVTEEDDPESNDKNSFMSFSRSVESEKALNAWLQ
jgi:hypothetical protein